MQKQKRPTAENEKGSDGSEPEWVTRILEVYERIMEENDPRRNPKIRN
jgi:hypothetical protein